MRRLQQPLLASKCTTPRLSYPFNSSRPSSAVTWRPAAPFSSRIAAQAVAEDAPEAPSPSHDTKPERPRFEELGVDRLFLTGLAKMKVQRAVDIQAAVVPQVLSLHNVAMQSYTGSGKTLAFLLPAMTLAIKRAEALYKAGEQDVPIQLLVVAPGQELAMQITRVAQQLLPDEHRRMVQQCIGGANPKYQEDALLMNKPMIIVGTPGRLSEFVRMGLLRLHKCPIMVLDEADQLLAPNFSEDLHLLNEHCGRRLAEQADAMQARNLELPRTRQTILVSATLSQSVLTRTARWCPDPHFVTQGVVAAAAPPPPAAGPAPSGPAAAPAWGWGTKGWDGPAAAFAPKTEGSAGGVEGSAAPSLPPQLQHFYVVVEQRHKADALRRCIHALGAQRALVFMNYQQRLKDTMYRLEARRMKSAAMHGEMSKLARANILNDFRRGRIRALIVSDIVARGLDVSECDVVFNEELPSSAAHYAHRAGRTGRMDAPGTVVSIVSPSEVFVIEKLSKRLGVPIVEMHPSYGQMVPGPAPAGQRPEDSDAEDEAPEGSSNSRGKASGAVGERSKGQVSSRGQERVGVSKSAERERPRVKGGDAGDGAGASSSGKRGSSGGVGDEARSGKEAKAGRGRSEAKGGVEEDGEENEAVDDKEFEEELQKAAKKSAAVRRGRGEGGREGEAGGRGEGADAADPRAAGVMSELQRELQELRQEKAVAREERQARTKSARGAGEEERPARRR